MQIKVITLNIWKGGKLFEPLVTFLKKEQADLLLLQEVYQSMGEGKTVQERSYQELKTLLHYPYTAYAPEYFFKENSIDCGNAIFSRFPLYPYKPVFYKSHYQAVSKAEPFSEFPRNILRADISIHGKLLSAFVTHGIWGEHGGDTPDRLVMGRVITDEIVKTETSILGGDFNCESKTKTIRGIEKYMKNIFADELTTSFNIKQKTKKGYATAVVDMLFVSPDIAVIDHMCPSVDISDHLPLITTLAV